MRSRQTTGPTRRCALACRLPLALLLLLSLRAPAERYTFQTYDLQSGLANINITTLLETRGGVIWAGTQKGVFRANESRWEEQDAFTEAGIEGVWAMGEDNEGRVWAADGSHVVYWENGRVHRIGFKLHIFHVDGVGLVRVPGQPDTMYLLHDGDLQRIATADHGKTWQVSDAFSPALLRSYPELHQLSSIVAVRGSSAWAGCGKVICSLDLSRGTVKKYAAEQGVAADSWRNFLLTRSGELWARGQHSVVRLLAHGDRFSPVTGVPKAKYLDISPSSLLEDRNGRIVMNLTEGLLQTDGKRWQLLNQANGLPQDEIDVMIFDHTGALWLAPSGRGISRWLGYGKWQGWTKADGLSSNIVLGIAEDAAGAKWVATETGLDKLDAGSTRVTHPGKLPLHELTAIATQAGHVWAGDSLGRVVDFNPATGRIRIALDHVDSIYQLLADKEGRIWVCSLHGLYYFAPADRWAKPHPIESPLLPEGNAYGISEGAPGVLWVMTEKGVYRLNGDSWSAIQIPVDAGPSYNLMVAAAADGTLWVQSRHPSKIVHLRVQGHVASVLSQFSDPIMEAENLGFMGMDRRGWLWIESDRGLQAFDGERWVRSSTEDGLLFDNSDYPAFLAAADGSIWIGTSSGLAHMLHPEDIFKAPRPEINFVDLQLGPSPLREGVAEGFDLRKPSLSVRLLGTNYTRAAAIVYRYRLEGLESAWQETDSNSLRFPALAPGKYTLRISAYDRRLHESSEEHSVSFTVLEPWWNRTWFHGVEQLAALVLLFVGWRLSVRLLVRRQRELEGMVAARTRELEQEKADLLGARSALIEMTRRDNLTGLLNRAAIFERMQALCEVSLATGSKLAIVMADIDHFKRINDEHGHVVGDLAIRECANRLAKTIRPVDFVGRYGGEELLILMPGLDPASASARMEELRTSIAGEPIRHGQAVLHITCSFGVAWTGSERCALETLVNTADEALYRAKKNGRNRVEFAVSEEVAVAQPG